MDQPVCLNCGKTEEQVPLIVLTFNGETRHLCPQCFPIMIHKPGRLTDKLPGFDASSIQPHEH